MEHFLYNGLNLAAWQSVGKTEYFMERLRILGIGFARIFAPSIFLSFNNFSTTSSVTFEKLDLLGSRSKIF